MKVTKHSTDPKKISKAQLRREMDNEIAIYSFDKRNWPIPKERIITYGKDLLLMFEEDEQMISILPWKRKHKLTKNQIDYYARTLDDFKEMVDEFKEQVGLRSFEKGFHKKADPTFAAKAFGMYNQDYRDYIVWQNNLKKEVANSAQEKATLNVYMTDFPSSGKVPDKASSDKTNKKEIE